MNVERTQTIIVMRWTDSVPGGAAMDSFRSAFIRTEKQPSILEPTERRPPLSELKQQQPSL